MLSKLIVIKITTEIYQKLDFENDFSILWGQSRYSILIVNLLVINPDCPLVSKTKAHDFGGKVVILL